MDPAMAAYETLGPTHPTTLAAGSSSLKLKRILMIGWKKWNRKLRTQAREWSCDNNNERLESDSFHRFIDGWARLLFSINPIMAAPVICCATEATIIYQSVSLQQNSFEAFKPTRLDYTFYIYLFMLFSCDVSLGWFTFWFRFTSNPVSNHFQLIGSTRFCVDSFFLWFILYIYIFFFFAAECFFVTRSSRKLVREINWLVHYKDWWFWLVSDAI